MALQDILDYYVALLILQYKTKPKARATINLLANQSACDGLVQDEQVCFDLDVALGAQLTILGRIVGVPRNIYGLDLSHTYWAFTTYSGVPTGVGFGRYTDDPYSIDLFQRYVIDATYTLSDFEMRALIRLKIIYNTAYSSFQKIKEGLYQVFLGDIDIEEYAPMELSYIIQPEYLIVGRVASFLGIFPRPMGNRVTVYNVGSSSSSSRSSSSRSSSSSSSSL